jgi:hypothetical protein
LLVCAPSLTQPSDKLKHLEKNPGDISAIELMEAILHKCVKPRRLKFLTTFGVLAPPGTSLDEGGVEWLRLPSKVLGAWQEGHRRFQETHGKLEFSSTEGRIQVHDPQQSAFLLQINRRLLSGIRRWSPVRHSAMSSPQAGGDPSTAVGRKDTYVRKCKRYQAKGLAKDMVLSKPGNSQGAVQQHFIESHARRGGQQALQSVDSGLSYRSTIQISTSAEQERVRIGGTSKDSTCWDEA